MSPEERAAILAAAVKIMEERADELKFLLAAETGQPPTIVDMMQYGAAMAAFKYYAGAADKFTWRDFRDGIYGQTMVLREPIGVVGAVTAWNVPFFLAANKLGPALLAGCTDRAEASRRDAAVAVRDGRDVRRGRPARGRAVGRARRRRRPGRALTANPEIDKFTFTGSAAPWARRSPRSPPRSSSRARWSWAASPRPSSSRTPTWTRRCRCWCSPG